jgi:hypothetical protein
MTAARNLRMSALAGKVAVAAAVLIPAASDGSTEPLDAKAHYMPVQSISYEFGSKFMSGYFVQDAATCFVTLISLKRAIRNTSCLSLPRVFACR